MSDVDGKPIVSLCLAAFGGAERAAVNLSLTTGLSRHLTLSSPNPQSPEIDFTIAHLRERRPAVVIFNGWSAVYARILAGLRRQPIQFAVHWHSGPGQTDIAGEWPALSEVMGERRVAHLLFASEALRETLAARLRNAHHLPETLADAEWSAGPPGRPVARAARPRRAQITLFAQPAESARKNVTGCLLALGALRSRVCLHLNGLSREPRYRTLLELLRIRYRDWGWMEPQRYDAVVRAASMGLQVSFAETYGYVVAEHLARGVPVVGSPAVPVLARLSPALRRRLVVANPDNPSEIRETIRFLLDHPRVAAAVGARAHAESSRWNRRDIAKATAVLQGLLSQRGRPRRDPPPR
jgi:glycosyltransferase involved in cell wall biosynthesis